MNVSDEILTLHAHACDDEEAGYLDPETGLFVLTSFYLRERGYCCGNGCRHCPFTESEQREAERPEVDAFPYPESK